MKIFATGGYLTFWDCLANSIKSNRFTCFTPGLTHLLKAVTYVTWHIKGVRKLS